MSTDTGCLMVDTQRLVQAATEDGWGYAATRLLWALAGKPSDEWPSVIGPDTLIELPAQWRYDDLAPKLDERQRLAAVEALDVDVRLIGSVLLAMARRIFLPYLPAGHAASRPTKALLDAFEGWVIGSEPAETYVGEAFRYRSRFGTWSSGTDEKYQYLFEAMPADGLCCALGERRWRLARHWRSFALFLASDRLEWEVLDDMDERIDETVFVTTHGDLDLARDKEATEAAHQIVDSMREACIDAVQDEWDPKLTELLDELLPALRNLWFKTAGTA